MAGAVVLTLAVTTSVVLAQQMPTTETRTGVIAGRVTDISSDQPLPYSTVSLQTGRGVQSKTRRAVADSQGRYVFTSLPLASYTITADREGYRSVASAFVDIRDDAVHRDVPVQLGRMGVVSGRVRDSVGDPVVGVTVVALTRTLFGRPAPFAARRSATTDDRGEYRITQLYPGDYLVCVCGYERPLSERALAHLMSLPATVPAMGVIPPTFHPGARLVSNVVPTPVNYGDDLPHVDISVTAAPTVSVSGRVAGPPGATSEDFAIALVPSGNSPEVELVTQVPPPARLDAGGFVFRHVPAGDYSLVAFPKTLAKGDTPFWARTPIRVEDKDVANLEVTLHSGVRVAGRVDFCGTTVGPTPRELEQFHVYLKPAVPSVLSLMATGASGAAARHNAALSPTGEFLFDGVVPGEYELLVVSPLNSWQSVTSIQTPHGVQSHQLVSIGSAAETRLLATMGHEALSTVEGVRPLERYEAGADTWIVLVPADPQLWQTPGGASGRFLFTPLSAEGTFSFSRVPAGEYYVGATLAGSDWMTPPRLERLARTAERITVRSGETQSVLLAAGGTNRRD